MSNFRVLQVIDEIGLNSGVSSMLMNYYRHMDHSKINFDFIVFEDITEDDRQLLQQNHSKLYEMPKLTAYNILSFKINKELKKVLKENSGYKIIHGHVPNASFIYMKEAKKAGIPFRIIHSHNSRGADTFIKKIRNYILHKYGLLYANRYCACSRKAATYLFGPKGLSDEVRIINNGVDIQKFKYDKSIRDTVRKELNIEDKFVIGHVGRFCEQKNHRYLIEVFKETIEIIPNSVLILIGKGQDENEIKKKVREYGMEDSVIFAGLTDQVSQYMQAMDAFLLPSLYEGLPVVCVEAQASGLSCVVASTVTDEVRILDDFQFADLEDSPVTWAQCLEKIYRQDVGDVERKRTRAAQAVIDAGFDIVRESKKLEKYYFDLVGQETI